MPALWSERGRSTVSRISHIHDYVKFDPHHGERNLHLKRWRPLSLWGGHLDGVCRVDGEPGDQQALRQAADALDKEGCARAPATQSPGTERRSAGDLRALVWNDDQYTPFTSSGGVGASV